MKMKCSDNCGYYWKGEGERYASCYYPDDDPFPAPCEYEEEEEEEED